MTDGNSAKLPPGTLGVAIPGLNFVEKLERP